MAGGLMMPTRRRLLQYGLMLPLVACSGNDEHSSSEDERATTGIYVANGKALDAVRAAYLNARWEPLFINWVGDSLTAGQMAEKSGATIDNVRAFEESAPGQLGSIFAQEFDLPVGGAISPIFTGKDARVTVVGLKAATTTGPLGMVARASKKLDSRLRIDCPQSSVIDILYYNNNRDPNTGAFAYVIDDGFSTNVPLASPFGTNKVVSWTGESAAHQVTLTSTDRSNENLWQGVRFHSGKGVVISRYGRPGWTSNDMLGLGELNGGADEKGKYRLAVGLAAGNPQLVIIAIGHNDWARQKSDGTNPQIYAENLDYVVKILTDRQHTVLLLSTPVPPTVDDTLKSNAASLADYWQAARSVAGKYALCAYANLADVWNPEGDVTRALKLGLYAGPTTVHSSRKGYAVTAAIVHSIITRNFVLNTSAPK